MTSFARQCRRCTGLRVYRNIHLHHRVHRDGQAHVLSSLEGDRPGAQPPRSHPCRRPCLSASASSIAAANPLADGHPGIHFRLLVAACGLIYELVAGTLATISSETASFNSPPSSARIFSPWASAALSPATSTVASRIASYGLSFFSASSAAFPPRSDACVLPHQGFELILYAVVIVMGVLGRA